MSETKRCPPCAECRHHDASDRDGAETWCRAQDTYVVPTSPESCSYFEAIVPDETERRTRAALAAVEGIPTEALESGALGALITAAEHQRDTPPGAQPQLLAALRSLGRI